MVVTAITATSISLSWSVVGGSVARSEVVWRETDRGTESSSGSLTGTSYTIDQLESTTIYTVTVRASNAGGTTDSQPITFSTGIAIHIIASFMFIAVFITIIKPASDVKTENMVTETIDTYCDTDNSAVIIGGLVAVVLILAVTASVIVILVLRCCCDSRPSAKSGHVNTHTYMLHAHMFHTQYLCCSLCREVTDSQTVVNQIPLLLTHTCTHAHTHTLSPSP